MSRSLPARAGALLAGLALLAVLLPGCGESRRAAELPVAFGGPRVDVFLRASGTATVDVTLELESVYLLATDGSRVELDLQRGTVSSAEAARRLSLAGGAVPAGGYRALAVEVRGASVRRGGARTALRLLPQEVARTAVLEPLPEPYPAGEPSTDEDEPAFPAYELTVALEVGSRGAATIFLEWNVDASLVEEDGLRLALGATQERPAGRLGLLYVTDAAAGTVLSVQRATGEVVGSVAAGPEPRALAVGIANVRVFTANAGDGSLAILDARTGWTRFSVPIQLGARTSDVAVVEEGRLVAATNPELDSVSIFDLGLVARITDVPVGRRPVRLVTAGSLRRVFVAEELSDSLSVIDVAREAVVATIPVGTGPSYVAVDRRDREVIVGHRSSPDLLFFDAETYSPVATVPVGDGVTAILADRRRNRVYVARERPTEIAVVDRDLMSVIRRIRVSGRVTGMTQPIEGSLIYGAAPELGALVVVNVLRGREEDPLPCGSAPSDVVATD